MGKAARKEVEEFDNNSYSIRDVAVKIEGLTPYSPSKETDDKKLPSESWDTYEARIWRNKAHVDDKGYMYIPGVAFKLALDETAQLSNQKIPGKNNQTFTMTFKSGVTAISDLKLGVHIGDVNSEPVYCNANGKRGPGPRVNRLFPILREWEGIVAFRVFNDSLTQEKFEEFFTKAGLVAGVGRGRPNTGCPMGNGRYKTIEFKWGVPPKTA